MWSNIVQAELIKENNMNKECKFDKEQMNEWSWETQNTNQMMLYKWHESVISKAPFT